MGFDSLLLSIKNRNFHIDLYSRLEVAVDNGLAVGKLFQMKKKFDEEGFGYLV